MLKFDTQTESRGKYTVRPMDGMGPKVKKGVPIADAEAGFQCSHMAECRFWGDLKNPEVHIHQHHGIPGIIFYNIYL